MQLVVVVSCFPAALPVLPLGSTNDQWGETLLELVRRCLFILPLTADHKSGHVNHLYQVCGSPQNTRARLLPDTDLVIAAPCSQIVDPSLSQKCSWHQQSGRPEQGEALSRSFAALQIQDQSTLLDQIFILSAIPFIKHGLLKLELD